ncbi:PREDICTED: KIF1-binding protein-like [Dinoponera quadriceps]|uniref:KIF-binding protein n=1 Tax=Dinoponera quadriceps TaxID=609295 RepID=A0A6P3YFU0_DINQU|nr:PREDICTED: KIF1-binding protein-like [Dinoponera quadriceps]
MEVDKDSYMSASTRREKYLKVQKMMDNLSPNDKSEIEEVISILMELIDELNNKMASSTSENLVVMLAILHLNLGTIYVNLDKTIIAEKELITCTDLLKDIELEPSSIMPMIKALNQLGILYAKCEAEKAKVSLEKAEKLYTEFTENIQLIPIDIDVTMGIDTEGLDACKLLDKIHTMTLFYLAQVYGELNDKDWFAAYCHKTLSMQLRLDSMDNIDWALNAATLSQYFIDHDNFTQARYHLASASYILQKHRDALEAKGPKETSESIAAEYETYHHRSADVARCWAQYGITLLGTSKERLLKRVEQEDQSDDSSSAATATESMKSTMELMKFVDIDPELEAIVGQVTDQYLLDFEDARPVFLNVQKWLNEAKTYYTLNNHASDYARIVQDISQAFKFLLFYEVHEDRQAKMHKRRIDILENLDQGLNSRYYQNISREIWQELGEIYAEIMEIKLSRLQASDEKPTAQMITKINHLAKNSIKYFDCYVNSLPKINKFDEVPTYSDDYLYQALHTQFLMGRLHGKIITSDLKLRIENMQNSLDKYEFIMDYCNRHPEKEEELKKHEFISVCREFVSLLPLTLHRMKQQLTAQ